MRASDELVVATMHGDIETARRLLREGVGVNELGSFGQTALHLACWKDHVDIVRLLLEANADVNVVNTSGVTALRQAVDRGHIDIMQLLLEASTMWPEKDKEMALLYAASKGAIKLVKLLLEASVNVNARNAVGRTALQLAVDRNHIDIVQLLLEASTMLGEKDKEMALLYAASKGAIKLVKLLLEASVNVNAQDEMKSTALHRASMAGHNEIVKLLLQANANVDAQDEGRWTALHRMSYRGIVDIGTLLVQAKANVDIQDNDGWTPLHIASSRAQRAFVRLLLDVPCDITKLDTKGRAAVHLGLSKRDIRSYLRELNDSSMEVLRMLAGRGAKWDTKCDQLDTSRQLLSEAPALKVCFKMWEREYERGLPLTEIPHEVVKSGVTATEIYVREKLKSRQLIKHAKVCLVGPSNWGKTSLIKSVTTLAPSLEHLDARTIGIDHSKLRIEIWVPGEEVPHVYEVTFWDFAGQDAYQVAHSLFFSYRTLYLVCVDLQSYAAALAQGELLSDTDAHLERYMDEFVDTKIFKWIRMIVARQPDAEFVFVATKADVLKEKDSRIHKVRSDLMKRLHRYVEESAKAIGQVFRRGAPVDLDEVEEIIDKSTDVVSFTRLGERCDVREHEALLTSLQRLSAPKWVVVNCKTQSAVKHARLEIEKVVTESERSFQMPDLYSKVLVEVCAMRGSISSSFYVSVPEVFRRLRVKIEVFDQQTCEAILQVLHHLGDILWYQDLGIKELLNVVILNPMQLIDLIRQIVNHNLRGEVVTHLQLKNLPLWGELDRRLMLMVKRLLQEFNLFHPSRGEMRWNSDLIVPAFWQSKTKASWLFGGQPLCLNESVTTSVRDGRVVCVLTTTPMELEETTRVLWEYHFVGMLPESLFDQLVVASYSSLRDRQVGPDWILYEKENNFACRLIVTRNFTTKERVMRLEAVAVGSPSELWWCFRRLCESLERVLRRFRGLVVDRQAFINQGESRSLEDVVGDWMEELPEDRAAYTWLPPDLTWYDDILSKTEELTTQAHARESMAAATESARVGEKRERQWE